MSFEITDEIKERAKYINEQSNKSVLPPQNLFYYYSIYYSAECSLTAFEKYRFLLNERSEAFYLISSLQEAVGHAANLSWYFFNVGGNRKPKEISEFIKKRSNDLKIEFEISDNSILKDRELRNMFEHFDEKLDIFLLNTLAGTFYPTPRLGNIKNINKYEIDKNFKMLDIENSCLVLFNKFFYFEEIEKEVMKVYEIAESKINKLG